MKRFVKSMVVAFAVSLAAPAFAANNPFSDVPQGHWAYKAVQQAAEQGILSGYDGKFRGDKTVTRYQMAVIVARMLDKVEPMGGKGSKKDVQNLEALVIEFADELALLNVKVSTLEDAFADLKKDVDSIKKDHHHGKDRAGISGLGQGRLVVTDDVGPAGAATGGINRYAVGPAGIGERAFGNIGQVSLAFDRHYDEDFYLHLQLDFDADNEAAFVGGGNVQVNEAFVDAERWLWDGDIRIRAGTYALPFQRERNPEMVDYPNQLRYGFRSLDLTVTPSLQDQVWESVRLLGASLWNGKDSCFKWQVGVTNSPFTGTNRDGSLLAWKLSAFGGAGFGGAVRGDALQSIDNNNFGAGTQNDVGYYAWAGDKYAGGFRWDAGYFNSGGNLSAGAGSAPDFDGYQVNAGWWGWEDWGFMGSYFNTTSQSLTSAGGVSVAGPAAYLFPAIAPVPTLTGGRVFPSLESSAYSLLVNYKFNDDNNATVRYEDVEDSFGPAEISGTVLTVGWNHHISPNSLLQLEYTMPETEVVPAAVVGGALAAGARNAVDINDDLLMLNYKVRF